MVKRKHLGLIFEYNEEWIGGTYYFLNLVNALNILNDQEKPLITIISPTITGMEFIKKETNYPYLNYTKDCSKVSLMDKAINAITLRTLKKKIIDAKLKNIYDLVYPNPNSNFYNNIDQEKKAYWIFDFQEAHLPEFFTVQDIIDRKQQQIEYAYKAKKIVFSSNDSLQDFKTLYPFSKAACFVVQFSVTHPDFSYVSFESVKTKHNIDRPYFYCPNQYWAHKNHITLIHAVKELISEYKDVLILTSGKETDYRQPQHFSYLRDTIKSLGLDNNFKFLGFLERKEQLCIMKNAKAIIQPSLFEGWSTVVEDAKALNKLIVASDLKVHREQFENNKNTLFFEPKNPKDLQEKIKSVIKNNVSITEYNYSDNKFKHAKAFTELFKPINN